MAKKRIVNKTQLIKDALAESPDASPIEIAKQLKKYKITAAYVSGVKSSMKDVKRKKTGRKPGRPAKGASRPTFAVSSLLKAKKLEELGGVEQAKSVLDAVAKLTD